MIFHSRRFVGCGSVLVLLIAVPGPVLACCRSSDDSIEKAYWWPEKRAFVAKRVFVYEEGRSITYGVYDAFMKGRAGLTVHSGSSEGDCRFWSSSPKSDPEAEKIAEAWAEACRAKMKGLPPPPEDWKNPGFRERSERHWAQAQLLRGELEKVVFGIPGLEPLTAQADCPVRLTEGTEGKSLVYDDRPSGTRFNLISLPSDIDGSRFEYSLGGCSAVGPRLLVKVVKEEVPSCHHGRDELFVVLDRSDLEYMRLNAQGYRALAAKDFVRAEELLKASLAVNPAYWHANYNMACLLALNGRPFGEGRAYLDAVFAHASLSALYLGKVLKDPDLASWRGSDEFTSWLKTKEVSVAEHSFCGLPQGNSARAVYERAHYYFLLKQYNYALRDFRKAVDLDGSLVEGWVNLAAVRAKMGQNEDALSALGRAVALDPEKTKRLVARDKDFGELMRTPDFPQELKP